GLYPRFISVGGEGVDEEGRHVPLVRRRSAAARLRPQLRDRLARLENPAAATTVGRPFHPGAAENELDTMTSALASTASPADCLRIYSPAPPAGPLHALNLQL